MGSIPSGGTTDIQPVSAALKQLLDDVGKASFYLNTIVVGLDAVEHGHPKPASLDIKWDPVDRKTASRMARHFAVEAFIVRASEALKAFIKAYSALPRFQQIVERWDGDTGLPEKIDAIGSALLGNDDHLVSGAVVISLWRNRIVHSGKFSLPQRHQKVLKDQAEAIHAAYRNLDIAELLRHAREGRPTLKDASCLIAMMINLARAMDERVYPAFDKVDFLRWVDHFGLRPTIRKVLRETSPERIAPSLIRVFRTNAPRLEADFQRFGEPDGSDFR